jgi:hypothetical protein
MPKDTLERYCEVVAALKVRTSNKKGRHLSTSEAIRLLEEEGINTPDGDLQAPKGLLKKATVNRYLKQWGYDYETLRRQPPAVRFQAEQSNECWHFDLSPSDLKHVKSPASIEPGRGHPLLMLYSVVDDRSGVAYQEYHEVYGEDVGAALRFLFAAMSAKKEETFPFQGIPKMLYMDNGPIARSSVFNKVMSYLGVEVRTHLPQGSDGRRVTARAKGKVERPFRTVKEMHETLYRTQKRADRIEALAKQLALPGTIAAVRLEELKGQIIEFPRVSFVDPDPFDEFFFPTVIAAKKAIANYLGKPLAKLTPEQMAYVNEVVEKTLNKQEVIAQIRDYFTSGRSPC